MTTAEQRPKFRTAAEALAWANERIEKLERERDEYKRLYGIEDKAAERYVAERDALQEQVDRVLGCTDNQCKKMHYPLYDSRDVHRVW